MDYSNAYENFNQFRDASQQEADTRNRETGEVLLGFADPLLMKGTETAIQSWITKRKNNLKFREQEQARMGQGGEEGEVQPEVELPQQVELQPLPFEHPTPHTMAQQQMMDADPEDIGGVGAEVGEEVGEEAGGILAEGGELALDTSFMPEVSAAIGVGAVIASSVVAFVDLFKHEKTPPAPMANMPQIGL